jgi:hypothetical protein
MRVKARPLGRKKMIKADLEQNQTAPARMHVILGGKVAGIHLLAFAISAFWAGQGEGWTGVYIWPIWALIDIPWSLLYAVLLQHDFREWTKAASTQSNILPFILYPPYFIHGIVGTIWWGIVPGIYLRYRRQKSGA